MKRIFPYIKLLLIAGFIAMMFYYISGEQLKYTEIKLEMAQQDSLLPEPDVETVIEQKINMQVDMIQSISFQPFSYGRENKGTIDFYLVDEAQNIIIATSVNAKDCVDYMPYTMLFGQNIPVIKGENYTLRLVFHETAGVNPTFYYSTVTEEGSGFLVNDTLSINGNLIEDSALCLGMTGIEREWLGVYYWHIAIGIIILLMTYQLWSDYQTRRGKFTIATLISAIWKHYRFLIEQLVARDFKVKYKRSVLGYFWSFLNPLMTMLVQYVVFSTIFRFGIGNFPVYLLAGNIIFSFFTEAVSQGIMSIVGNASLITKVYVPKYIYPVTKVLSTSINLFISVIPLLLVTLITGEEINLTILLLPYALICLLIFSLGIVLFLSAINVFFRDVEYLWNIISLIWMYATPIFYPAEIIPEKFRFIQTLNPLYHIIVLVRTVLMEGISPKPEVYLYSMMGAVLSLAIGASVFKKTQGKFVLYI